MSDKNEKIVNEEKGINKHMQSFSTSVVSLHSYTGSHKNEKKTEKLSDSKPSIIYFLALFYAFLSMGFGTGLIGPTLLKFGEQINTSFDRVVYILFTRSFGFLGGTLIGGALIDRFASFGQTILAVAIFIMTTATLIIPFMYHLIPMIIVHLMWSLTAGIVDNLAQILTIRHYEQSNVNPYLQALHGAFGVGALISPLIIAPFLEKSSPIDQWHYAYWLIGFLHVPNFIWILIYAIRDELCSKKSQEMNLENKEFVSEGIIASEDKPKLSENLSPKNIFILGLITLFLLLYVGGESGFGAYLHTYASLHLQFEKDIAAYLNSVFWASFAFGRLCGIPLSMKFSALKMIFFDLIGCIGSLTLLCLLNKSSLILWIGSILFGLSVASIYPSAIGYTEKYLSITGKRMSILAVGGAAGDAVIPLLIGYSIDPKWFGPIGFISISLVVVIMASLIFGFIVLFIKFQSRKGKNSDKENIAEKKILELQVQDEFLHQNENVQQKTV
jgi:FHS family Na+ dependent glucose MFS transporter 1